MLTMKRLSMKGDSIAKARTHCVQRVTPQHKEIIPRDRAATLPPCNLFPMDPVQPKCPVVQSPKLQRQRSKSTPDFSVIPYQTAICHFFSYKKRKWRNMRIQVQLAPLPFARGSSRAAFYMKVAHPQTQHEIQIHQHQNLQYINTNKVQHTQKINSPT